MYSHVVLGAKNVQESKVFYDAILGALGHQPGVISEEGNRSYYMTESGAFVVCEPINGEPASAGNGSTISFAAHNKEAVDNWHAAGIANGGSICEDPPGVREGGGFQYYAAYLRDPSGNKICALHSMN